jgi:spermidine/putrescine transport system ATP-binding protein/putrescine transport system ATP-binding protein
MQDFLNIRNVSKRFGGTTAVEHADLTVARGEFFSLLGPSGCGKTTLLRIIGGFTDPDSGSIEIDGEDISSQPPNRRPVNMVFQSYAIFPHLNVADNIAYGLRAEGMERAERDRRVQAALKLIALPGYGLRRAHELSGGERQRVALARALVKRPKVLLLDEPLGALDKRLRENMQVELRALQRQVGISFIFVTHDQEEALAMSDRIAVMEKGRVLQVADPGTLYERPNSRAVASFIGTMNFLRGRIVRLGSGGAVADIAGFGHVVVPRNTDAQLREGGSVVAAIRPEKLVLNSNGHSAPGARGQIASAVYLGDRMHVRVSISGAATPLTISTLPSPGMQTGAEVQVSLSPEHMLLFPE